MSDAISFLNGVDGGVRNARKKNQEKNREKEKEVNHIIFSFFPFKLSRNCYIA
jgi:hypothetical protein